MALEDGNSDRERLHLVVQPILAHEDTVCEDIELHRIAQCLFAAVLEHIVELIHIFQLVGDREGAAFIFTVRIECRCGSLLAVLVLQKQEDTCRRRTGSACRDTRISRDIGTAYGCANSCQCHEYDVHDSHIFKAQRNIGLQHEAFVYLTSVLHPEVLGDGAAVMETVVHAESGQIADISSDKVEIRLPAKVYQVGPVRTIRNIMFEYGVRNRIAAIEDDVTYSDDCLLVLAVAHLLETERTAFVHRDFVMLVRPGAINGLVENQLLVGINPEIVVIHHVILAQACRIEADPVIFSG